MVTTITVRPSEVLSARRDEVLSLIRSHGGENPRVFGSVARGSDAPGSDIDIVVTVEQEKAWEFVSLSRELSELLGVHVDVVTDGGLKPKHAELLQDARPL